MELLTRNNFEDWMQKLMERLDRQDELLLSLRPSGNLDFETFEKIIASRINSMLLCVQDNNRNYRDIPLLRYL